MRTDRVSFIHTRNGDAEQFLCRETGVAYSIECDRVMDCYTVRNSGVRISERRNRLDALALIEQTAALDFATAQAESAWAISEIELDGTFAV